MQVFYLSGDGSHEDISVNKTIKNPHYCFVQFDRYFTAFDS